MQSLSPLSQKKIDDTANMLIGASVAVVFIAAATIGGELYMPIKDWLASIFSHHWIGKGVLAMLVFIVASGLSNRRETRITDIEDFIAMLFWISFLSALAIAGFFGYEVFLK